MRLEDRFAALTRKNVMTLKMPGCRWPWPVYLVIV